MSPRDSSRDKSTFASAVWRSETLHLDNLPAMGIRIYGQRAKGESQPLVLHFHGGNFTGGSLDSGYVIARLLAEAGAIVVSLDYPLAPKNAFPSAVEAGQAALTWVSKLGNRSKLAGRSSKVFVAGEEAGGNIAAAVAMVARDRQQSKLRGQILISPMLNPWLSTASMRNADVGTEGCRWDLGWHGYLQSPSDANHPYASPGTASRLAGLPQALLLTAIDDPMRDDTFAYAHRLREAGVAAEGMVLPGPTGWPCELMDRRSIDSPWAAETRQRFQHFFASVEGPQLAPSSHSSLSL